MEGRNSGSVRIFRQKGLFWGNLDFWVDLAFLAGERLSPTRIRASDVLLAACQHFWTAVAGPKTFFTPHNTPKNAADTREQDTPGPTTAF